MYHNYDTPPYNFVFACLQNVCYKSCFPFPPMKRPIHFLLLATGLLMAVCLLGACSGKKQKTQEQISEDYHKYLTTPDLAMYELQGNVFSAEYPEGFLQQYVPDLPQSADTVFFMPDGVSGLSIMLRDDNLLTVRGTSGEAIGFCSETDSGNKLACHYKDDRNVDSWEWHNAEGDSITIRFKKQGRQVTSFTVKGHKKLLGGTIKDIVTDDIGNWTERTVLTRYADGTKFIQRQKRIINYY